MRKSLYILLILLIFSGCSSLKQGWNNFKAYYNTFHNAKDFYSDGLDKNLSQLPDLNPNKPIRIYRQPTGAGLDDFQQAIEKGESILRNHTASKYVIPSLFIIGKSHYYRSEFFSALEQFQRIANATDGIERQDALIWQGITYYDLGNYSEGIEVMLYAMDSAMDWEPGHLARARAATAQLQAASENWVNATSYLEMALPDLPEDELKARAYFLLGQMYEERAMINEALFAYSQIGEIRTTFDMEFNALRKRAEMLRATGNFEQSADLYRAMLRDDKYLEYRNDLRFDIAKTLQASGRTGEAIEQYRNVLENPLQTPNATIRAKTYFSLGEIYRDNKKNFVMAAAYFDSAASENANPEALPPEFEAEELAQSFGEYVAVKREISEKDSLLNLAKMGEEERREFLAELRAQRLREAEEQLDELQERRTQMLVAEPEPELADAGLNNEDGFLNIKSPARLADASLRFQAIWGDRPLADNWRRREAVSGSRFDNLREEPVEGMAGESEIAGATGINPVIDLSGIPFSPEEQEQTLREIEELNYQLANVFFLSMDLPDSASIYYHKVLSSSRDSTLVAKSIYSLAEIELEEGSREGAFQWYRQLQEVDTGGEFQRRLANQLDQDIEVESQQQERRDVETFMVPNGNSDYRHLDPDQIREAAMKATDDSQRPVLLFDAARAYMKAARLQTDEAQISRWFQVQDSIKSAMRHFEALKDSAEVMLQDTSLTAEQSAFWTQISDSTLTESVPHMEFPFQGAYWDSTRTLLNQLQSEYPSGPYSDEVQNLLTTLKIPEADSSEETEAEESREGDRSTPSCTDMDIEIAYDGGMDAFMESLDYPAWTQNVTIRGELEYELTILPDGTPTELQQMSNMDRSGIPEAVEKGIREKLYFSNPSQETVKCRVIFPISL